MLPPFSYEMAAEQLASGQKCLRRICGNMGMQFAWHLPWIEGNPLPWRITGLIEAEPGLNLFAQPEHHRAEGLPAPIRTGSDADRRFGIVK